MKKKSTLEQELIEAQQHDFNRMIEFARRPWDFTHKQKKIITACCNERNRVIFLYGPAGSTKTILAVYSALLSMSKGSERDLLYIRTVAESASKSMGALPGNTEEKLNPFTLPLMEKLEELLTPSSLTAVKNGERVESMPVNHIRGASWTNKFIVVDETQNFTKKEIATVLTRMGKDCTIICCGDPKQSDINGRSGFIDTINAFNDEESQNEGILCFELTADDVLRDPIIKFIVKKLGL